MRIGINATGLLAKASIDAFVTHARQAEADGFASYWLAEHPTGGLDALTVLTVVGQAVETMEVGTAVIPTYPRHPMVLAAQTLTTQQAIRGDLCMGIGLSHQVMMGALGMTDSKPILHLREYLSVLLPLLREGRVSFHGETISCEAELFRPAENPPDVVVAALGPQMLKVAGARTEGTSLAWVGPKTIENHIVPRINEAAAAAGRGTPRVIATLPICVTDNPVELRERITMASAMYVELPSYQAMFAREGVTSPGELGIVGTEAEVEDAVAHLESIGVTDLSASEFCTSSAEREQTRALLSRLARAR
jgi:5,10-methylenetetrahydromethanopterin reductase